MPKVLHFLWKACSSCLPTMASLFSKKVVKSHIFPICHEYPELIEHLLFLCPWVRGIWFGLPLNYKVNLQEISTIDDWLLLVSSKLNVSKSFCRKLWCWISFTLWIIWKVRCEVIYDHVAPNYIGNVHRISAAIAEFLGVN